MQFIKLRHARIHCQRTNTKSHTTIMKYSQKRRGKTQLNHLAQCGKAIK